MNFEFNNSISDMENVNRNFQEPEITAVIKEICSKYFKETNFTFLTFLQG